MQDESGKILRWYGTNIDIEDRKRREKALQASELSWRQIIDNIPGYVHTTSAMGEVEFHNRQTQEYFGKTKEELKDWGRNDIVHPDDLPRVIEARKKSIEAGQIYEVEHRCRRADGVYRWFQVRGLPVRDAENKVTAWYLLLTDIDDRKKAEEALQSSERNLSLMINAIPTFIHVLRSNGTVQYLNQAAMDYFGITLDDAQKEDYRARFFYPEDVERLRGERREALTRAVPFENEQRALGKDGKYRWFLIRYNPLLDEQGRIDRWYVAAFDIEDRKRAEEALQSNERNLNVMINTIPALIHTGRPDGYLDYFNRPWLEYLGCSLVDVEGWNWTAWIHPEDVKGIVAKWRACLATGEIFEYETRVRNANGEYRWMFHRKVPLRDAAGKILKWYGTSLDIEDRKRAEDALHARELDARSLLDNMPGLLLRLSPDGTPEFVNRPALQYVGKTLEEIRKWRTSDIVHPDDLAHAIQVFGNGISTGQPFDFEYRARRFDGVYRWFQARVVPVRNVKGQILHWNTLITDIDDRKRAEEARKLAEEALKDQLYKENLALRDEVERASMFDEIVGTSSLLKAVLSRIAKVAPTDSTVLITGETGTGKELIARAIHRKSRRAGRAFVSVNCAAIPRDLIPSELFGHEKGAFTGATQRRLGRFELADGGTIFLDEVGELLPDTQVALLRVLQEREFERVGGGQPIHVDVRVIAATNRDLEAAVANGTFRQDLFYRLNVFPIEVPPLRARKDDLELLVGYFVQRYGVKAGKDMRSIEKKTLDLLQSYDWPGNIRELQNVIERSVIVSSGGVFSVDESWLSKKSVSPAPAVKASSLAQGQVAKSQPRSEREIIEAALAATRGRVSGPSGAAAKLGIPASTLEARIRVLRINKLQFKFH